MNRILTTVKLALPAAFVLLLAGCITDPYQYRGGYGGYGYGGDYYYGRPSVDYRHHGGYYGGYGYPYYGRSGWSFSMRYGYPFGYGYGRYGYDRYGYGGWPYYYGGWPPYPPIVVRPRPDPDPGTDPDTDPEGPPPWRDLDRLRTGGEIPPIQNDPRMPRPVSQPPRTFRPDVSRPDVSRPPVTRAPRPQVERPARSGGSRMERVRRAAEDRDER